MSIVTTYTCDHCGHAQKNRDSMIALEVTFVFMDLSTRAQAIGSKIWCRKCVDGCNLLARFPSDDVRPKEQQPSISFEDLVREVAREEIAAAGGGG